ncbi:unnamed protein product [Brachionus calyciflorus]|uniref:SAM domain-containing protein n=1 Tax=Brachionus calyciflorus TaxID=104777 RepID=A0A813T5V0_9BILA|nr:unnamed protein product [Brachionus calyciflorus]
MKSLISNYLNSRRSIRLDETFQITTVPSTTTTTNETDNFNQVVVSVTNEQNESKQAENDKNNLETSILKLDLKYIDDNDSDSTSNMSFENNNNNNLNSNLENSSQQNSMDKNQVKTSEYLLESLDKLNIFIENLLVQQYQSQITNKKLDFLSKHNKVLNNNINQTQNYLVNQIKSCLCYIDHFLSNEKPRMTEVITQENHFLDQNPHLLTENKLLKEKIRSLEERLKKNMDQDMNQMKEAFETMKLERKRYKLEKVELLNRTKDLYKTIESKENQIKTILKTYETKAKDTCLTVKKLLENKNEIENEKQALESYVDELIDENKELKLLIESKNASINKLKKQLYDLKSKSPRYSLGKESDYGYSSSKSRDTLSSSMIETNVTKIEPKPKTAPKYKTKKEERSLKCKSNDSYLYIKNNQLNETSHSLTYSSSNTSSKSNTNKIKNKLKFNNKLSTSMSYHNNLDDKKCSKSNNNLSFIMSSSDYDETDLNKVLDSDEFIDLDENMNKTIHEKTDQNSLIVSTTSSSSSSSSSSSTSFNTNSSLVKNLEISSTGTIASVSPSVSLTSSSTSSKMTDLNKPLTLNLSTESETSSSDLSPLVMSQSITICEDDNLNKTSHDFSNTSRYSIKQPLSVSMSVQTPNSNVKSRSSRIINTIIRMTNRSSAFIETTKQTIPTSYSTTLSSSKVKNRHSHYCNINTHFVSSKSSYCVRETDDEYEMDTKNLLDKSFKILDDGSNCKHGSINQWNQHEIKTWLENLGLPSAYVKNALKYLTSGKLLINMSDHEMEKIFQIANNIHKRKIRLALDDLKNPDKCKYTKLGNISTEWLVNTWLKEIGLVYLQGIFRLNLVDGRVLASLQKKDLEKYFGVTRKIHQNSLLLAIELLKKYDFDVDKVNELRNNAHKENQILDICLWTNDNFIEWLKLVNLNEYVCKLSESGLHGALVVENSFNTDSLFHCLGIEDEAKYHNIKKILDDEIKLLKKTKSNMKLESAFTRPLSSFKNDKQRMFTFRGSLGRALGKKIKRDISSPLIDDDTFKKIEFSHKIVDMKTIQSNLA